jgi:hypothetical protein
VHELNYTESKPRSFVIQRPAFSCFSLRPFATERRYGPRNLNLGDRKTDRRDFGPGALQAGPGNGQGRMLASALVEPNEGASPMCL